ncbi:MAG TPA: 5-formyltetrahydrofolate cyclo-ligase [Candidatus Acidoferrales bacterium]|nr:5-formyltetrahydrofolate cyclo-ligase [Candidatus Acidoferrales bacterium]
MKTKDALRSAVWKILQQEKVARFPGAEGRIPNFIGAEKCAAVLAQSRLWRAAKTIKCNPDAPQRAIRQRALVPRLSSRKPFLELDPKGLKVSPFRASTIGGAAKYGRPVSVDEMNPVDLIVCGSVAVNRSGARIGKGGGYSDLEYALLREAGKLTDRTPIVTSVHPLQVVDAEIPMTEHDIPLDAIVTPSRLIALKPRYPKPKGIYWPLLSPEKIEAIPLLKRRRRG